VASKRMLRRQPLAFLIGLVGMGHVRRCGRWEVGPRCCCGCCWCCVNDDECAALTKTPAAASRSLGDLKRRK
jgi:hypothetical protein